MMTPAKPIIEPSDKSNSPPIISKRDGDGEDAELRRDLEEVDDAARAEQAAVAGEDGEEQISTSTQPAAAPSSGRIQPGRANPICAPARLATFLLASSVTAISGGPSSSAEWCQARNDTAKIAGPDPVE
jgi:hypothetical protein